MKVKLSDLELLQINLLSTFAHFNPGSEKEVNDFFLTDDIDIDFKILNHKKNKLQFKILLLVKINDDPKMRKPGYSIVVTMEGVFRVQNEISDEEYFNLKFVSAMPMMISNLRASLSDITSKFPAGAYLLPSIDLTELIKQKSLSDKKTKTKVPRKKK